MTSIADIATRGGLQPHGRGAWGPCPVCGAERRGRGERRGPISVFNTSEGEAWKCHASGCGVGGGAAALLAAVRFREIPPKGDERWREVMAELEPFQPSPTARFVTSRARERSPKPSNAMETAAPTYPPDAEVEAVWQAGLPLDRLPHDDPSLGFLKRRGLSAALLTQLDLARALPAAIHPRPAWLPRSTPDLHRLVVGLHDADGKLRSLRFRAIREPAKPAKSLPPIGYNLSGLVMADPLALALLRGQRADDDGMPWDGRVVIAEGETDWWTLAAHPRRHERARAEGKTHAVFGVVAGSWSDAVAARIPSQAQVVVWTDLDSAGDRYAETVRASLASRCTVLRRPSSLGEP